MARYTVGISEVLSYLVSVEADNASEAERKAEELFHASQDPFADYGVELVAHEIDGVNEA